jgi:hypothetical protein
MNSSLRDLRWSQAELVQHANEYAARGLRYAAMDGSSPPLLAKTVGKSA